MKLASNLLMILTFTLLLEGCSLLQTLPDSIKIPVPVYCNIKIPEKSYMPYTDVQVEAVPLEAKKDVYYWNQLMLAEIELRKGYEVKLEAAAVSCNESSKKAK